MSYDDYIAWKGWSEKPIETSASMTSLFSREIAEVGPLTGKRVLEVGFGDGSFLNFAASQGADVVGIEVQDDLVRRAKAQNFNVLTLQEFSPDKLDKFDLIFAFDVIEHISPEATKNWLETLGQCLNEGGKIFLRYPNSSSPFGRLNQHGDITHINFVSASKLTQWLVGTNLDVEKSRNEKYSWRSDTISKTILKTVFNIFVLPLRIFLGALISFIFYGTIIPMSLNEVTIIRKADKK